MDRLFLNFGGCRFDGGVRRAAQGPQLHPAHEPPGLEDKEAGAAGDPGHGAVRGREGGADPPGEHLHQPQEAAHGIQALHRVGVDDAVAGVRGVRDDGVGRQPAADAAAVPRQHRLLARVLLPDGGLQLAPVPQRHGQPRPALHPLGHPAQAAPALPHRQGLPPDAAQRGRLRAQVQGRRPRAGPHRQGHPPPPGPRRPLRLRRLVLRGRRPKRRRRALLQPAGAREARGRQARRRVQAAQGHAQEDAVAEEFQEAAV
uniref:Uncharacterized protein n=1 Tax=Zea mays TaxID=4577 RepID=C0PC24_MAIZE|nr:unknown [Zea mays]